MCFWKQLSRKIKTNIISSLKVRSERHCTACISQSCFVPFALLWHKWTFKPADDTDHLGGTDKRNLFFRRLRAFLTSGSCLPHHWAKSFHLWALISEQSNMQVAQLQPQHAPPWAGSANELSITLSLKINCTNSQILTFFISS